jgi:hypothetical protein
MMQYRFAKRRSFEDFSGGRFFYARPGQPAFPVRLASEIFLRALAHRRAADGCSSCTLYDPVCGGAYWLAVLAYLHWDQIDTIYASDSDAEVLSLAERNLSLLTPAGLNQRIAEIESLLVEFGKQSHADALQSALRLRQHLGMQITRKPIATHVFQANAVDAESILQGLGEQRVDIVLADVPYGWKSEWQIRNAEWQMKGEGDQPAVEQMLKALRPILKPESVVAVAADKGQKIQHENYIRLEKFQVGRRRIELLRISNAEW